MDWLHFNRTLINITHYRKIITFAGGGTEIKLDSPEEEEKKPINNDDCKVNDEKIEKVKESSSPPSLPITETAPSAPPAAKTTQSIDNDWISEEMTKEEVRYDFETSETCC